MKVNILVLLAATLIPMVLGFIWYNPKVFGKAWMTACGLDEEKLKGGNMIVIFGVSLLLSFFLAFSLQFVTIHQFSFNSILGMQPDSADPNSQSAQLMAKIMELYGNSFRTFKHGALHGTIAGFTMALPILGTNAMFEKKGFKYIAINCGYWIVCMALMGGVICAFS